MRHAFAYDKMSADGVGCGLHNVGIGQARRPVIHFSAATEH
jgi:hypothetical protein